jgi:hypothetical protein
VARPQVACRQCRHARSARLPSCRPGSRWCSYPPRGNERPSSWRDRGQTSDGGAKIRACAADNDRGRRAAPTGQVGGDRHPRGLAGREPGLVGAFLLGLDAAICPGVQLRHPRCRAGARPFADRAGRRSAVAPGRRAGHLPLRAALPAKIALVLAHVCSGGWLNSAGADPLHVSRAGDERSGGHVRSTQVNSWSMKSLAATTSLRHIAGGFRLPCGRYLSKWFWWLLQHRAPARAGRQGSSGQRSCAYDRACRSGLCHRLCAL